MDIESLLTQAMETQLASQMYSSMSSSSRESTFNSGTTRMAFDSQMRGTSSMYSVSAQNMTDAANMVTVAQTGVTSIKYQLNQMYEIATEMASLDNISAEQYASYSSQLQQHVDYINQLANEIEFNGMSLLNGTAGMNEDGVVVLSAGGESMDQTLYNMVNSDLTTVIGSDGSMNLSLLSDEVANISTKEQAEMLVDNLTTYIQRVEGIEGTYSYNIQALTNMAVMFEDNAAILENTIQYPDSTTSEYSTADLLSSLLAYQSTGSLYSSES